MTRASAFVVFSLFAAGTSCRTPEAKREGKTVWVMPADLACASDDDCTIGDADRGCCCSCDACVGSREPFAISKRASAAWAEVCAGAMCTMDYCEGPVGHRAEDFRAACVNQACERRPKR